MEEIPRFNILKMIKFQKDKVPNKHTLTHFKIKKLQFINSIKERKKIKKRQKKSVIIYHFPHLYRNFKILIKICLKQQPSLQIKIMMSANF